VGADESQFLATYLVLLGLLVDVPKASPLEKGRDMDVVVAFAAVVSVFVAIYLANDNLRVDKGREEAQDEHARLAGGHNFEDAARETDCPRVEAHEAEAPALVEDCGSN